MSYRLIYKILMWKNQVLCNFLRFWMIKEFWVWMETLVSTLTSFGGNFIEVRNPCFKIAFLWLQFKYFQCWIFRIHVSRSDRRFKSWNLIMFSTHLKLTLLLCQLSLKKSDLKNPLWYKISLTNTYFILTYFW